MSSLKTLGGRAVGMCMGWVDEFLQFNDPIHTHPTWLGWKKSNPTQPITGGPTQLTWIWLDPWVWNIF